MKKDRREKDNLIGNFIGNRRGFGFVSLLQKEEGEQDIYISPDDTNGAMDGDLVEVDLLPSWLWRGARKEGIVSKVVERKLKEVVGTFRVRRKECIVHPADTKLGFVIRIGAKDMSGARNGDKVVVKLLSYPDRKGVATGHISSIIARNGETGADLKELIRSKGYLYTFPSSANAQAKAIGKKKIGEEEYIGRRDLRGRKIFTIDGAYSKDFDDAVSISRKEDGTYVLGVHIADVTHYVTEGSPLDREALKRGNSVYVIDQVIPMLPEELSNGICSLNEGVDRLCLSVEMVVDRNGRVVSHDIFESVISSCHRLVYDDVSDILENGDGNLCEKYADILEDLMIMNELYEILDQARRARGAIEFEVPEAEILLDREGKACDVRIASRRTANKLIEEFMLLANETVAEHFFWLGIPFIYRVHERPEAMKIAELKQFLARFSIPLKGDPANVHPRVLNEVLQGIEGTPKEILISTIMLRSMQKAYYATDCGGHYGLSLTYYTHFTSPIRRYSDLFIHRVIKEMLHGSMDADRISKVASMAETAAENASKMERLAMEAERDGEKMKKAEYMAGHIGEQFDGIISGVTSSGMFVALDNTIEGFVSLDTMMDDYYDADLERYRLIGHRTRKIYALGDKVKVKCIGANVYAHTVDFALYAERKKKKRRKPRIYWNELD